MTQKEGEFLDFVRGRCVWKSKFTEHAGEEFTVVLFDRASEFIHHTDDILTVLMSVYRPADFNREIEVYFRIRTGSIVVPTQKRSTRSPSGV